MIYFIFPKDRKFLQKKYISYDNLYHISKIKLKYIFYWLNQNLLPFNLGKHTNIFYDKNQILFSLILFLFISFPDTLLIRKNHIDLIKSGSFFLFFLNLRIIFRKKNADSIRRTANDLEKKDNISRLIFSLLFLTCKHVS